jgi:hypothetical protein
MPGLIRVRFDEVMFGANPPAGMNPLVLMSMTYAYRSGTGEPFPPAEVTRASGGYRIHDGRHRAVAAMIAGRPDFQARLVDRHERGA